MEDQFGQLPKLKSADVTRTIQLANKIFVVRPWKTKDERNFLIKQATTKTDGSDIAIEKLMINELIKPCVIEGDFDTLSYNELKKIMVDIRCISMGDDLKGVTIKCGHCGHTNIFDANIEDENLVNYTPTDTSLHTINDELKVRFKSVPHTKLSSNSTEIDYVYENIDELVIEDKSYKNFSKKDFELFFDDLDLNTTKIFLEKLKNSTDSTTIIKTIKCMHCSEDIIVNFEDMPNFLKP